MFELKKITVWSKKNEANYLIEKLLINSSDLYCIDLKCDSNGIVSAILHYSQSIKFLDRYKNEDENEILELEKTLLKYSLESGVKVKK